MSPAYLFVKGVALIQWVVSAINTLRSCVMLLLVLAVVLSFFLCGGVGYMIGSAG